MRKVFVGILSVMLVFSLAGCGSKQTVPEFNAQYYPQCYDPIAKLCKDQDNSSEIKGAATGAAIGALGGALAGGLASGSWKGAAVGAAAGAVAGGMTGFFTARLAKISDRNERLKEYQKSFGEISKNWDLERASVEKAYKCYREQIAALTKAAKAKKISKEDFLARMNEIKAGVENINKYWADAQHRMDESLADGEAFIAKQEAEDAAKLAKAKLPQAKKEMQRLRSANNQQKTKNDSTNKEKDQTDNEVQQAFAFAALDENWA